jgi:hypothetical protein
LGGWVVLPPPHAWRKSVRVFCGGDIEKLNKLGTD